jgi:membrane dipeptidase
MEGLVHRRTFMTSIGAAALSLQLSPVLHAQRRAGRASAGSIRVDALSGVEGLGFAGDDAKPFATAEHLQAIRNGSVNILSQTFGQVGNGPDRFQLAVRGIAEADQFIAQHAEALMKIESAGDIWRAKRSGKLGVIYNFQDTTGLEGEASRVKLFKTLGLRVQQLTYNKRNLAGDGCLERSNAGLSDFGREVIAAVNENRLLLDLSHAGQRTIAEGIAESKAPPAITHTGCRDLVDLPRNTFDREMRAVAQKGGVIGIYLMPFLRAKGQPGPEDLLRHLDHAVSVAGEDHVGIGTDGPVLGFTIDDEARKAQREFYEERAKRGIAAPGEAADVLNVVEGYHGADRYERIASDLRRRGWSSGRVDKVLGNNFVRLYTEVWGA